MTPEIEAIRALLKAHGNDKPIPVPPDLLRRVLITLVHDKTKDEPLGTWWLSFADNGFKGVIILEGHGFIDAQQKSFDYGNPGGEVQGAPIPPELVPLIPADCMNRLLSRAEAERVSSALDGVDEENKC